MSDEFKDRCGRARVDGAPRLETLQEVLAKFNRHDILEPVSTKPEPAKAEVVTASEASLFRWYAGRVSSLNPGKVEDKIRETGAATYHPKITKWQPVRSPKRGQPRKRAVTLSLFPGYVFTGFRMHADRNFGDMRGIHGFHGFIAAHGNPIEIASGKIASIMAEEEAGLYDETRDRGSKFAKGQRVRIKDGPFAGMIGAVSKLKADERCVVLLDHLFGSASRTSVTLAVENFEAAL